MEENGYLPSSSQRSEDGKNERKSSEIGGILPSKEGSEDRAGGQLPSSKESAAYENKSKASVPSEDRPGTPEASPGEKRFEDTRRERIRRATAKGGLNELPAGFGDSKKGDWPVAQSENPFEVLYLDHEQHKAISPSMVKQHYELLRDFWAGKIRTLDSGVKQQARQIKRKYGGPHESTRLVRQHEERTKKAFQRLSVPGGIEACYEELNRSRLDQGRQALGPLLALSLRNNVLDRSETEGLFEEGHRAGLQEGEVASLIEEQLRARGFEPLRDPQGETLRERLRSVEWMTHEKRQERKKQAVSASAPVLKIGRGEARSLTELVDLCDENWEEAQDALFHGYVEAWLGNQLGETTLARKIRQIQEGHQSEQSKGLELAVRRLCRAGAERDPHPQVTAEPDKIDLSGCPVGVQHAVEVRLLTKGPRRAWGVIEVEGEVPGLEVPEAFDIAQHQIRLWLDTVDVPPGEYEGEIVIRAEGGVEPARVPVAYNVTPLEVDLRPAKLALGGIAFGEEVRSSLQVSCTPSEGRLVGTAALRPYVEGVQVAGALDGASSTLKLAVDTSRLQAGKHYKTSARMDTNVGEITVPVSFRVTLDWKTVLGWTAGVAGAVGLLLGFVRYALAGAEPGLSGWFLSFSEDGGIQVAAAVLGVILILITWGTVRGYSSIKQKWMAAKAAG